MAKDEIPKTPRTYRLGNDLVEELKRFRNELRMRPSETAIVEAALWDFINKEREEAKRGARR